MRVRKSHTKSRLGCLQCKQRHVRCTGETPTCDNCSRRKTACSLRALAPSAGTRTLMRLSAPANPSGLSSGSSSSSSPTSPSSSNPSSSKISSVGLPSPVPRPVSPSSAGSASTTPSTPQSIPQSIDTTFGFCSGDPTGIDTIRDRELLYVFLNHTALTLSSHTEHGLRIWQFDIPRLALSSTSLRGTLLATAALTLARLSGPTSHRYRPLIIDATKRLNAVLPQYRQEVSQLTAVNADAVIANALIIAFYQFVDSTLEYRTLSSISSSMSRLDVNERKVHLWRGTVRAARGAIAVLHNTETWLRFGPFSSFCIADDWPQEIILNTPLSKADDARLVVLEDLLAVGDDDPSVLQALSQALWQLRHCFSLTAWLSQEDVCNANMGKSYTPAFTSRTVGFVYETAPDIGALTHWVNYFSNDFRALLENQHPHAMVLFAHWGILAHRASFYYSWLSGLAELYVTSAMETIEPGMECWIQWPVDVVMNGETVHS